MLFFMLLIALVLWVHPADAATYYVATTGSDSNPGSSGSPFRSIQKCANTMVAGDTCIVKNGTYTDTDGGGIQSAGLIAYIRSACCVDGTSGSPITLKAENPLGAVLSIDGSQNGNNVGIYITRSYWIIEGFDFTTSSVNAGASAAHHGVYIASGTGTIVRKNRFQNIARILCSNSAFGNNGVFATSSTGAIIEDNLFYTIGRLRNGESGCTTDKVNHDHGIYLKTTTNFTIRRNILYDVNRGYAFHLYGGTNTNTSIYNNTVGGTNATSLPTGCVMFGSTITTANMKNNLFYDCKGTVIDTFSFTGTNVTVSYNKQSTDDTSGDNMFNPALPSGVTTSNNTDNVSLGFTNAGSNDFTLASGSTAIDAGTNIGLAYNGAAPDLGAFETPSVASAEVGNVDATSLIITFNNNANPPLLPSSGVTGITVRENTTPVTVSSCTRVGDNVVDCTLASSISAGTTVDWSYAQTGNLTDSALIGGTVNQELLTVTNSSVTNNVSGGGPTHVFTQAAFEFHDLRGTEAAPVILPYATAPENTSLKVVPGAKFRLRFAITCTTADCPAVGFIPRYRRNGGAYTVVPDSFGADNIAFFGTSADPDIPTSGTATTDQLSTSGTLVACALVRTSNAIPTVDLALNNKTECEYAFALDSDVAPGDTFDFRLYLQDGTALNTYTVTPRVTVEAVSGGVAELWDWMLLTMIPVLARIDANTTKPVSNFTVQYPTVDTVLVEGVNCTGLKTSGTGLKRTVTCLH